MQTFFVTAGGAVVSTIFFLQVDNVEILMSLLIGYNKGKKKRERRELLLFEFFSVFLHRVRYCFFIKNNLKNTKNILTVRSNIV